MMKHVEYPRHYIINVLQTRPHFRPIYTQETGQAKSEIELQFYEAQPWFLSIWRRNWPWLHDHWKCNENGES